MKKQLILLPFLLFFSGKIFAQYESEENTFKRQLVSLNDQFSDKVKYLKELNGGFFVTVGDIDKSIPVRRDTAELGLKIRALESNLQKIYKVRKAVK